MKAVLMVLVLCSAGSSDALKIVQNSINDKATRQFDIILYGATGFTGRLAVQYLRNHPESPKWAIAGRNLAALQALHKEAALGTDVDFITADLSDEVALQALTERGRVVISVAGPYSEYHGENLIRSCIRSGTHYADLSGETFWQQKVIQELHEPAKQAGVKIVLGAGFDSVPSDLSVLLSAQSLGGPPAKVKAVFTNINGYMSGGTLASMGAAKKDEEYRLSVNQKPVSEDAYVLAPDMPSEFRVDTPATNIREKHFDSDFNEDLEPSSFADVNSAIVRRSLSLLYPNARCSYSEGKTHSSTTQLETFMVREGDTAVTLWPKRGEGPPDWMLKDGSFALQAVALGQDGRKATVKVSGRGDPGYAATSKMLVEAGLGLLHSQVQRYGVLTPSSALGLELVQRLKAAENGTFMQFEVSQA